MNTGQPRPYLKFVALETTRRCNLRCVHCAVSEENNLGNYDARDLPIELFRKLLPMLRGFRPGVQLSGHGETFLHPNFMEMLEEVSRAGCQVTFQTNGTILNARSAEKIVRAGVDSIYISIDGASPELFEAIRRRARLDKIVDNIRLINETKKRLRKDRPHLGFEFVAMRQNIHELPAVVRMAGELGVKNFQVAELAEYNLTRGQSLANDPLMLEWAPQAEAEARGWGINLKLPPNIPGRQVVGRVSNAVAIDPTNPATYKGLRRTCKEPWESMFVQFSGEVRPCCVIDESYGNLSTQSFEEVWYGPKYGSLRESLLTDEPFSKCVRCPLYGWERIDSFQATLGAVITRDAVSGAEASIANPKDTSGAAVDTASRWRRLIRKLLGAPECPVQLSDQQLLWLLNRLNSPDPQGEFEEIREEARSLPESCLALLEDGEPLSDTAFVERAYKSILGREPDEQGFNRHVQALRSGHASRAQVVALFLSSMEFKRILAAPSPAPSPGIDVDSTTTQMQQDWDKRARENSRFYIDTGHFESEEAFEKAGECDVENHILQGIELHPGATVLEIGCGIGRLLKPLARRAAAVIGVDISGEMVRQARIRLSAYPNVVVHKTDGTLSMVAPSSVDYCFSFVVFQHFPAKQPVFDYFHEVARVLCPAGIFRFQVNQRSEKFDRLHLPDTWDGVGLDHSEVIAQLEQAGFRVVDTWGETTHYAWYTAEEVRQARPTGTESLVRHHQTAMDPTAASRVFERIGEKLSESTREALLSRQVAWRLALEFLLKKWSSLTNEEFVRETYRVLLNRRFDREGFDAYVRWMEDGKLTRSVFLDCVVSSKEFRDVLAGLRG